MISQNKSSLLLAISLALLAGFIDAIGFLNLGGFFISFMSGNSTRLAVGISPDITILGLIPLGIIGMFVIGVMIGNTIGHFAGCHRVPVILGFISIVLMVAALLTLFEQTFTVTALMIIAMGAANNVFVKEEEVSIGVTYMTGTLVKLGQRLSNIFWGGNKKAWIPYFLLWLGLIGGAVIGSFLYSLVGLHAVGGGAAFAISIFLINLFRR